MKKTKENFINVYYSHDFYILLVAGVFLFCVDSARDRRRGHCTTQATVSR